MLFEFNIDPTITEDLLRGTIKEIQTILGYKNNFFVNSFDSFTDIDNYRWYIDSEIIEKDNKWYIVLFELVARGCISAEDLVVLLEEAASFKVIYDISHDIYNKSELLSQKLASFKTLVFIGSDRQIYYEFLNTGKVYTSVSEEA